MVCLNAHPSIHPSFIHPSIHPSFMSHLATSHFLHPFHLVVSADSKPLKEAGSQALSAVFRSRGCSRVPLSSPNRCSTVHPPTGHWFRASWNTSHDPLFVLRKTTHLFSKKGARHSAPSRHLSRMNRTPGKRVDIDIVHAHASGLPPPLFRNANARGWRGMVL